MNWAKRIWAWLRNRNRTRSMSSEPLREFVYLDEVSVYSLLASRKHGIATQFTESQTASLNSETGSSLNVGFAGIGSKIDAKTQSSQSQSSQVIRKATVQTSFKELHDLVKGSLWLSLPDTPSPTAIQNTSDIQRHFDELAKDRWIIDIAEMSRGGLLEANVALEADPLFRMTTVITTLYELMADRPDIFGSVPANQVKEVYSVGQVLDRLLAGLVPVRGRLMDFEAIRLGDKEVLAHRHIKDKLGMEYADDFIPVYVTGTAHESLFWKDIRQILFSESQYSVFCRLATEGMRNDWQPVKVVDLFEGLLPEFKEAINNASIMIRQMMKGRDNGETVEQSHDESPGTELVKEYVHLLEKFHQQLVSLDVMENEIIPVVPFGNWYMSVNERRIVLDEVTNLVERELDKETPGETRRSLRNKVFDDTDTVWVPSTTTFGQSIEQPRSGQSERFLDAEIVAIYW